MGCIVEKEEQAFISWTLLRRVAYPHMHGAARKGAKLVGKTYGEGVLLCVPLERETTKCMMGKAFVIIIL